MLACWLAGARQASRPREGREAPPDNIKPQRTIQSPDRLYKASKDYTKLTKDYTKTTNIRQHPKILDTDLKYLTRVATNINLIYNIKCIILKTTYTN